jgi:prepilin-type N-terminal cleavage/methylation domain-containing protein
MTQESGFTLIEVVIAVTLVALISLGLVMAMDTGFKAMQKSQDRLMHNRRVTGTEGVMEEEVAGLVPVSAPCLGNNTDTPGAQKITFFEGQPQSMRFVSTFSLQDGGRGVPRILEYQVAPIEDGVGVRLVLNERIYGGPYAAGVLCTGFRPDMEGKQIPAYRPIEVGPGSFVLADKLAACQFSYRVPAKPGKPARWVPVWAESKLPDAIRIDMAPLAPDPSAVQLLPLTLPVHVTRDPLFPYDP